MSSKSAAAQDTKDDIRREMSRAIKVNARPLTAASDLSRTRTATGAGAVDARPRRRQ